MMTSRIALAAAAASLLACVVRAGPPPEPPYQPITIQYGRIETVEAVERPSQAPAGAFVGGLLGLMLSGPSAAEKLVGMAAGAAGGAMVTAAAENASQTFAYGVRFLDGRAVRVIAEPLPLRPGDCVAVETGQWVNLRPVSPALCESAPRPDPLADKAQADAARCHAAKEELLRAQGREAVGAAVRKVRVLCGE